MRYSEEKYTLAVGEGRMYFVSENSLDDFKSRNPYSIFRDFDANVIIDTETGEVVKNRFATLPNKNLSNK